MRSLIALALLVSAATPWDAPRVTPDQMRQAMLKDQAILIVDVRSPEAFAKEHIPGAINVPFAQLKKGVKPPPTLRKDREAYLYCT